MSIVQCWTTKPPSVCDWPHLRKPDDGLNVSVTHTENNNHQAITPVFRGTHGDFTNDGEQSSS